jgi:WD40 repeat protein
MIEAVTPYDVFVSYAETDKAWVEGYLRSTLDAAGLRSLTQADFRLGAFWTAEFERAVARSRRVVLVLSGAYVADLRQQFIDNLARYHSLQTGDPTVIPLLLEAVPLPLGLEALVPLHAGTDQERQEAMKRLCRELGTPPPQPSPLLCPYPGMRPFTQEETHLFFGRRRERDDLVHRLVGQRHLVLIGPSGSGKSSLVLAGLLPDLKQSGLFGTTAWHFEVLRPGQRPQDRFAELPPGGPGGQYLLVVDQFEELFIRSEPEQARVFQQSLLGWVKEEQHWLVITTRADFYPELMVSPVWQALSANRYEVLPPGPEGLREAIVEPARAVGVYVDSALVERLLDDAASEPGVLPLLQETLRWLWEKRQRRYLPLSAYEALGRDGRTGLQVTLGLHANKVFDQIRQDLLKSILENFKDRLSQQQLGAVEAALPGYAESLVRRLLIRLVQFPEGRVPVRQRLSEGDLLAGFNGGLARQRFAGVAGVGKPLSIWVHQQTGQGLLEDLAGQEARHGELVCAGLIGGRLATATGGAPETAKEGEGTQPEQNDAIPSLARRPETDRKVDIAHEKLLDGWPRLVAWIRQSQEGELARRRLQAEVERYRDKQRGLLSRVDLAQVERDVVRCRQGDVGVPEGVDEWVRASWCWVWGLHGILALVPTLAVVILVLLWWNASTTANLRQELLTTETNRAEEQKARAEEAEKFSKELQTAMNIADQQRRFAQARQLAADATALWKGPKRLGMLAMLLGIEAHRRLPTSESFRMLNSATDLLPEVIAQYGHGLAGGASGYALAFNPAGTLLISGLGKTVIAFDVMKQRESLRVALPNDVRRFQMDPAGTFLAVAVGTRAGTGNAVLIRRLPDLREVRQVGFFSPISAMVFCSDRLIATDGEVVKVLRLQSNEADAEFVLSEKPDVVAFATDGKTLAVAKGSQITFYATLTGEKVRTIVGQLKDKDRFAVLVFSPTDRLLLTGTRKGKSKVWNLLNEARSVEKGRRENDVVIAAWSGDSTRIAQLDSEGYLTVWSATGGDDLAGGLSESEVRSGFYGFGLEFVSSDEVLGGSHSAAASLYMLQKRQRGRLRSGSGFDYVLHEEARLILDDFLMRLAKSKDGRLAAAMSGSGQVVIWRLSGRKARVTGEVWESPSGAYLQVVRADNLMVLKAEQLENREERRPAWITPRKADPGVFSDREKYFASVDDSGQVTGTVLKEVALGDKPCCVQFMPGNTTLLLASAGQVQELDLPTLAVRKRFDYEPRYTEVFSGKGHYFATRDFSFEPDKSGPLRLYDVSSKRKIRDFDVDSFDSHIEFSRDEQLLASALSDEAIGVWEIESGRQRCMCLVPTVGATFRISPDSRYLAASQERSIWAWDLRDGKLVLYQTREAGDQGDVEFSPDATTLVVSTTPESTVTGLTIWSIPDGKLLLDVPFDGPLHSARFSNSGRHLLVCQHFRRGDQQPEERQTIWCLWRPEDVIADANKRKTRELTSEEWGRYLPTERLPEHPK